MDVNRSKIVFVTKITNAINVTLGYLTNSSLKKAAVLLQLF